MDIKPFSDPVVGKVLGRPLFRDAINSMGDIVVWTFTEILTDEGITGITPYRISPEMLALLKPAVVGEDPLNIQRIWDQMYWRCFNVGRKGLPIIAMSHIDIGLWDIIGKKLKTPVYKLLGGFRDRVPGYGSGGGISLSQEELVTEQMSYVAEGFKAVKMKLGRRDPREDIERVKAVRAAIGPDIDLMVDANNGWSVNNAMRMAKRLERFDVRWLEEPVVAEDYEGYAQVKASTEIPIAGGESEYTKYGFKELFHRDCIDVCQADVGKVGGITEYMKIAAMAEAYNLPMCPHGRGIVSAHCVAATPNGMIVEFFDANRYTNTTIRTFQEETGRRFMPHSIRPIKGWIDLPTVPGLGFDPDLEAVEAYRRKYGTITAEVARRTSRPVNHNLYLSL
ncbi:MAG: mandelate racemase/muconate lactonizing enzyme family protein [Candidatus Bathyarchaeota archaeon]|nr:mandelate racemase/muconate lactonizing enzyme family protein [Candidatus Bathyarchaeota archaeon]